MSNGTQAETAAQESPLQVEVHRSQTIATQAQTILDRVGSLTDRVCGSEPAAPTLVEGKKQHVNQIGGKVGEIQEAQSSTLAVQRNIADLITRLEQNL